MMIELIKKYKQLINYAIFGVLTTVINIGAFQLLDHNLNWNYMWANNMAWFISVLFAFFTNKTLVFGSKYTTKGAFTRELLAFFAARLASLLVDDAIMYVGVSLLGMNSLLTKIVDNIIVIIINYVLSKIIFKSDPMKSKKEEVAQSKDVR
ncbi:GtrA family protein [Lactobacillus sp. CC-MHH1034]|nr:GtrA family protein [Agrilactobacillus fermenti]